MNKEIRSIYLFYYSTKASFADVFVSDAFRNKYSIEARQIREFKEFRNKIINDLLK